MVTCGSPPGVTWNMQDVGLVCKEGVSARRINAECYKVNIEIAVRLLPVHGFGELLSSAGSVGSGLVGRRAVVHVHDCTFVGRVGCEGCL